MNTSNKNTFLSIILLAFFSCSKTETVSEKKEKLEKLKARQVQLIKEIENLEKEILNEGIDLNENAKITNVAVSVVKPTIFEHYIDVQGTVDGDENAFISAKVPAVVTKVYVSAGSMVKPGQVLAELDNDVIIKQLNALEVNLKLATEIFEKQKALWEKEIGSEIQYKQAKANMEALNEQFLSLKEQLKMYKITSSVNGVIDMVNIKIGQLATPGVPAFSIVNNNKLKIKANVSESYASIIKEGNPVLVYFPDINKTISSKIKYSGKGINTINRTIGIEIALPDDKEFIPNMIAKLKIVDYKNNNAIIAPINVIQFSADSKYVFVAETKNNKTYAKKTEVELGKTYNDKAEIISGLKPNDMLITVGYADLNDGDLINF